MIRIAVLGDIGSGKSHVAKQFGYPVFNADAEVARLYKKSRKCYNKLKKALPARSEDHTSELQSQAYLVCRLLLEKKNTTYYLPTYITYI